MSKKVIIASDSTCDLSPELIKKYNIKINPLHIVLDNVSYKDGVEISSQKVYETYESKGILPTTAALGIQEHIDFLKEFTDSGNEVVYFSISSDFSCNFNNARLAVENFEGVYVIDSKNLSTGIGLQVLHAAKLAEKGFSGEEINLEIEKIIPHIDASFVLETLVFLNKGGRCSALSLLGANLLKLRPCIEVKNGKMDLGKKYRGKMLDVIKQYITERLANKEDVVSDEIFITHSGCDEEIINESQRLVENLFPNKDVFVTRAGCTVSTHCGPGTLGVLFVRRSIVK